MYNSGVLSKRGNEGGNVNKVVAKSSPLSAQRAAAVSQIYEIANASGSSVDDVVTKLLVDMKSQEAMIYYLRNKHEIPFTNPVKMAMQTALFRFADIATIAKALNISDDEALTELENAEWQAMETNHPEGGILPIDVQAALLIVVSEFLDKAKGADISATAPGLLGAIKTITGDNYDASPAAILNMRTPDNFNNAGTINLGDFRPDVSTVDTSGVYSGSSSDGGGGFSWDSLFNTVNGAIGVIKNATGAVRDATGQVKDSSGTFNDILNDIGGGIGGASINKSSLPWIIGGGFLLIIVIIIIIYAAKRK